MAISDTRLATNVGGMICRLKSITTNPTNITIKAKIVLKNPFSISTGLKIAAIPTTRAIFAILDPIVALLVAGLIGKTAFFTFKKSINGLMDIRLPEEEEDIIRQCIRKYHNQIVDFQNLRTRKAGSERYVDFQLIVPRDYNIEEAHSICDKLEQNIADKLESISITIHLEPCIDQCLQCEVVCDSRL